MRLNDGYEYREQLGTDAAAKTLLAYLSQRRETGPERNCFQY